MVLCLLKNSLNKVTNFQVFTNKNNIFIDSIFQIFVNKNNIYSVQQIIKKLWDKNNSTYFRIYI